MRQFLLFCLALALVLLSVAFAYPKNNPRSQANRNRGQKGERAQWKKKEKKGNWTELRKPEEGDFIQIVEGESEIPIDLEGDGRKRTHRKQGRRKNDKIRDSLCEVTRVGRKHQKGQSLTCEAADEIEEALFCISSKLAEKHGMRQPNWEESSVLLGDIALSPDMAGEMADRVPGCEGTVKDKHREKGIFRSKRDKREITPRDYKLWDNRVVSITVSSTDPVVDTIAELDTEGNLIGGSLKTAIDFIEAHTCLDFVFYPMGSTLPGKHIKVQSAGSSGSCWSNIGQSSWGQKLNLGQYCSSLSTVEHEIMHALGVWHEQSRMDRDEHVTINFDNIDPNKVGNYGKCDSNSCIESDYEYDFGSIMHYGKWFFRASRDHGATMTATDGRYETTYPVRGQRHMTYLDLKQINNVYCGATTKTNHPAPMDKVCTGEDHCENGGYLNPSSCTSCLCPDYLQGDCTDTERFQGTPNRCGADATATSDWQEITSGPVVDGSQCAWIITSPAGSQIIYEVTSLKMYRIAGAGHCDEQWLEVREGQTGVPLESSDYVDFTNTGPRFCGSSTWRQTERTTPTNKLVLLLKDKDGSVSPGENMFTVRFKHNGETSPPQDCVFTWSDWTACSKTCGDGIRTRHAVISTQPTNGGQLCPDPESEPCTLQACPQVVNCAYTWSPWSGCSKTCGGGEQTRDITITTEAQNGGTPCPESPESQECNTQSCPTTTSSPARVYMCCLNSDTVEVCEKSGYKYHKSFPATLTTLNYPNTYPEFEMCRWLIRFDDRSVRIRLTFETMDIEDWWDPVDIFDNFYGEVIERCEYSNDCLGKSFTSGGRYITIRHVQRPNQTESENGTGFKISFVPI